MCRSPCAHRTELIFEETNECDTGIVEIFSNILPLPMTHTRNDFHSMGIDSSFNCSAAQKALIVALISDIVVIRLLNRLC